MHDTVNQVLCNLVSAFRLISWMEGVMCLNSSDEGNRHDLVWWKSSYILLDFFFISTVTKKLAVVALLLLGQHDLTTEVLFSCISQVTWKVNIRAMSRNNDHSFSGVFICIKILREKTKCVASSQLACFSYHWKTASLPFQGKMSAWCYVQIYALTL